METIQSRLSHNYAVRELNRLEQLRLCEQARADGLTQSDIAHRLFISQPEVHRILRKIELFPDLLRRTPREVILDFHAQKIDHEQMMTELRSWPFTFSEIVEPNNPEGQVSLGSWDEMTDAFHKDLIDGSDYQTIKNAVWPKAD